MDVDWSTLNTTSGTAAPPAELAPMLPAENIPLWGPCQRAGRLVSGLRGRLPNAP
jgi:hypothetical protein